MSNAANEPDGSRLQEPAARARTVGGMIGAVAARVRDGMAGLLVRLGVTPNVLTVAGLVLTACAACCLLIGAGHATPLAAGRTSTPTSWWPLVCTGILIVSFVTDMLDGAVARVGGLASRFGALLDSTLDRLGDLLVFFACALHFSFFGNLTYVALSLVAAANAVLISYIKARAENLVEHCGVGFWQRGERCGVFLTGVCFGHVPTTLWVLAVLPAFTVVRRMRHAHRRIADGPATRAMEVQGHRLPWRGPRGSVGYDLSLGSMLAFVIFGPIVAPALYGAADPLRDILTSLLGR